MKFKPQILESINSRVSGKMEVRKLGRDIYVTTSGLTQSGGLIKDLWSKTLKKTAKTHSLEKCSWLILGSATGTLAKIVATHYSPSRMVGVEMDPEMLRIGKEYFELGKITGLEIVQRDANKYIQSTTDNFDWVLVDLYVGDQLPKFVYSDRFISAVKKNGHQAIFNHLFYDPGKVKLAKSLSAKLATKFSHIQLIRELSNLLIVCS